MGCDGWAASMEGGREREGVVLSVSSVVSHTLPLD